MTKLTRSLIGSLMFTLLTFGAAPASAQAWQCAPFARMISGVQLFGAAASWWSQAVGKYAQGATPKLGSVLVFKAVGSMRSGHVATVSQIVSDRVIKVTHANWSIINGHRGQVERDVTVMDASDGNDWSKVRVFYKPINDVGIKAYPVYGFIYNGARALTRAVAGTPRLALDAAAL